MVGNRIAGQRAQALLECRGPADRSADACARGEQGFVARSMVS